MTTEAKVGAFTLLALALLGYIAAYLGSFGSEKGYAVQAVFGQVNGLKSGNLVRYAGVDIGKVSDIVAEGSGAKVTLSIQPEVKIPAGALISIGSDGLMGEKFIAISPGDMEIAGFLKDGDMIKGANQQGLDDLMVNANSVLLDIQKMVNSLNVVFGDERVKNALIDSAINTNELTRNLNQMSAVMARMAITNEEDMRMLINNLALMSKSMVSAAARVDGMLTDLDNNGQTVSDLRGAIANLNSTSRRVENMAIALEGVVTDPETAQSIKETLRNARGVTEKADRMLRQVSDIKTEVSAEVLYSGGADKYRTNADIRLHTSPNDFFLIGVNDIGEGNKTNLQIGSGSDKFAGRVGVFDNKAGVGMDTKLNDGLKFSVDAYDPNDFRVRLRAQYEFAPDTFLVGQTDNVNKSDERESFVGIRNSF